MVLPIEQTNPKILKVFESVIPEKELWRLRVVADVGESDGFTGGVLTVLEQRQVIKEGGEIVERWVPARDLSSVELQKVKCQD